MTPADLMRAVPHLPADLAQTYATPLTAAMAEFGIDTHARRAAFLAQVAHESGQFRNMSENLNYSAEGLANTWRNRYAQSDGKGGWLTVNMGGSKSYVPNALAKAIARNPQRIANNVYALRMGNGPEVSGDGWQFRGAGLIQLTGRDAHQRCADYFHMPLLALGDWLRSPEGACRSAGWYWMTNGCNALADAGDQVKVSRHVNLGDANSSKVPLGLGDRLALFQSIDKALA